MADSSDPRDELIPEGSSQSNGSDSDEDAEPTEPPDSQSGSTTGDTGSTDDGADQDGESDGADQDGESDGAEWEAEDGIPFAGDTAGDSDEDGSDDDDDAVDSGGEQDDGDPGGEQDDAVDPGGEQDDGDPGDGGDVGVGDDDDGNGDVEGTGDAAAVAESRGDGGTPATADDLGLGGIEGPESDEEMPLAAHIEEMMRRLAIVFLFGGLATLVAVTESTGMINYFWSYHIPAPLENRPRLYGPLELPLTRLKVAGIAGVVVGLPAFVYQTYRFMKPGLYETERRYYLAAVPTSLVLGGIGVAFAHFLVLPAVFSYFTRYTSDAATIAFGLAETFNLIVIMLAFMAIVFQIPLFIMLAIMMNLVTRQWLEDKRLLFWGAFLGIAFLFSPDPTGMAPIIVTLTMIVLYEGTLAALRWTGN